MKPFAHWLICCAIVEWRLSTLSHRITPNQEEV